MISLHRLNGQTVAINPDLITWIDVTPDTTVTLLGGDRIMVKELLDDVIAKIVAYRASIRIAAASIDAATPSAEVLEHSQIARAGNGRAPLSSVRPGERVSLTPSKPPPRDSSPPGSSRY